MATALASRDQINNNLIKNKTRYEEDNNCD